MGHGAVWWPHAWSGPTFFLTSFAHAPGPASTPIRLPHTFFFSFQFPNLWLSAPPNFPIFYLDPTIPPPSEIMHDYMPLLLFRLFVIILVRIPFLIITVSLTGLASLSNDLGHWTTCGCWCVCFNSLTRMKTLWRRTIWFFSAPSTHFTKILLLSGIHYF